MDLIDRIKDSVNTLDLPVKLTKRVLMADKESLVIYPLAGSRVTQSYMDGARDADINLEIAMSSKDGNLLESTLWQIQITSTCWTMSQVTMVVINLIISK